jgi:hypothetical protein
MIRSAIISDCGLFRYQLYRCWDDRKPCVTWIMLNPSTADDKVDDMTIMKCIAFSEIFGFGKMIVVNLYAFRTKSPQLLERHGYPVGPENDVHIVSAMFNSEMIIAAWGAHGRGKQRAKDIMALTASRDVMALKLLHGAVPGHPLMLPYKSQLVTVPKWIYA